MVLALYLAALAPRHTTAQTHTSYISHHMGLTLFHVDTLGLTCPSCADSDTH